MGNLGCIDWVKTQQLQVYHYPFLTVKGKGFCVYKTYTYKFRETAVYNFIQSSHSGLVTKALSQTAKWQNIKDLQKEEAM